MKSIRKITFLLVICLSLTGCGINGGAFTKYTPETLSSKIVYDEKYTTRDFKIGDIECQSIRFSGKNTNNDLYYDKCNYYIFKNNKASQKAFNYMNDKWIESETDSGKNFVQGWEADVCDASVEIFIYLTENMIITTEVQVVSEWAMPEDDTDDPFYAPPTNHKERVDYIKSHY